MVVSLTLSLGVSGVLLRHSCSLVPNSFDARDSTSVAHDVCILLYDYYYVLLNC